jgi:ABC-type multidrug transport system ATPase subunit
MTIRHGETIGVAGRSGCGKTTWLRVLIRLTHPSAGTVLLGGVPLESVSRQDIGELIGYVGQNPFLFAGTIAENIAYAHEGATADQIRRAAEMACIHDEIAQMPGGYDARIAERGQNLSGGQRQRIALARVFLKNPPILILDEGTSALDNISERRIQQAIAAARADRTVILVAHRLTTLLDTDRILVFDGGRVVETGPYQELVRRDGVFSELGPLRRGRHRARRGGRIARARRPDPWRCARGSARAAPDRPPRCAAARLTGPRPPRPRPAGPRPVDWISFQFFASSPVSQADFLQKDATPRGRGDGVLPPLPLGEGRV